MPGLPYRKTILRACDILSPDIVGSIPPSNAISVERPITTCGRSCFLAGEERPEADRSMLGDFDWLDWLDWPDLSRFGDFVPASQQSFSTRRASEAAVADRQPDVVRERDSGDEILPAIEFDA